MTILTRRNLTTAFAKAVIVNAQQPYSAQKAVKIKLEMDGPINRALMKTGQGAQVVGSLPADGKLSKDIYEKIDIPFLVIKQPGSLQHSLPPELAELKSAIGQIADIHFSISPHAVNDLGILTVRKNHIFPREVPAVGSMWSQGSGQALNAGALAAIGGAFSQLFKGGFFDALSLRQVKASELYSAYLVADNEPALFQVRDFPDAAHIFESFNQSAGNPHADPDKRALDSGKALKAKPYDIVLVNNYAYRKSAVPMQAGMQTQIQLTYLPT